MKKILYAILLLLFGVASYAQYDVGNANEEGETSEDKKSAYVHGLVRNGYADKLDTFFSAAPWEIQAKIDVYSNTQKTQSIAIFCVAVDLGLIEVVDVYLKHGIGPADMCVVRNFGTRQEVASRAERLVNTTITSTRATQGAGSTYATSSWFGFRRMAASVRTPDTSESTTTRSSDRYTEVHYRTVKTEKTYFASPLDFAGGDMFDKLWDAGFRSPNLLTKQALLAARAHDRQEIVDYILSKNIKNLLEKPLYMSEDDYETLLTAARENSSSLAFEALVSGSLSAKSSAEAGRNIDALKRTLEERLSRGVRSPSDTLGVRSVMLPGLERQKSALLSKERAAAATAAATARAAAAEKAAYEEGLENVRKKWWGSNPSKQLVEAVYKVVLEHPDYTLDRVKWDLYQSGDYATPVIEGVYVILKSEEGEEKEVHINLPLRGD